MARFLALSLLSVCLCTVSPSSISSENLRQCQTRNSGLLGFEVLPGRGWDNLVNEERRRVVIYNYSQCSLTEDGMFLIPDGIDVTPIKASQVEIYSERFDHWMNYTSDTARSVNVGGDTSILDVFHIGGKFSREYEEVKSNQVNDNSITLRVGARYHLFTAKSQPDIELDQLFRNKVLDIAHHIQFQRTDSARYESQLLVRDFGTHIITSVDAGALVSRVDSVNRSFALSSQMTKSNLALAASFSFFGKDIDFGVSNTVTDTTVTSYVQQRTHATVRSHGGPVYKPLNFSVNDWVAGINNNLVAIDRAGDPLHFLITSDLFPELPVSTIAEVANSVERAIVAYYNYNIHRGCTNIASPNFNFHANVDDGSCEMPGSNLSFGGVFQNCTFVGDTSNLCSTRTTINPKSGAMTCPEGYDPVLLYQGKVNATEIEHTCESFMIFWKKCHDIPHFGSAQYNSYWCAAHGEEVPPKSGYLFGGIYDNIKPNPLTENHNCPSYFFPLSVADDMKICVSDDYENAEQYSVPFGGLFSCQFGNPLANKYYTPLSLPKKCPESYSQHLATIDRECEINFCTLAHAFSGRVSIPVKVPPFVKRPKERNDTESYIITESERSWTRIYSVPNNFTGFNGIMSDWITEDGSYLDIAALLNDKTKNIPERREPSLDNSLETSVLDTDSSSSSAPRQVEKRNTSENSEMSSDNDEGDRSLTRSEVLAIAGMSSLITLASVFFAVFLVLIYRKAAKV